MLKWHRLVLNSIKTACITFIVSAMNSQSADKPARIDFAIFGSKNPINLRHHIYIFLFFSITKTQRSFLRCYLFWCILRHPCLPQILYILFNRITFLCFSLLHYLFVCIMSCAKFDAQRLAQVSFAKIINSKQQKGGTRLHKHLLVLHILQKIRTLQYATIR